METKPHCGWVNHVGGVIRWVKRGYSVGATWLFGGGVVRHKVITLRSSSSLIFVFLITKVSLFLFWFQHGVIIVEYFRLSVVFSVVERCGGDVIQFFIVNLVTTVSALSIKTS